MNKEDFQKIKNEQVATLENNEQPSVATVESEKSSQEFAEETLRQIEKDINSLPNIEEELQNIENSTVLNNSSTKNEIKNELNLDNKLNELDNEKKSVFDEAKLKIFEVIQKSRDGLKSFISKVSKTAIFETKNENISTHVKPHEEILSVNSIEKERKMLGGSCGETSLVHMKDDGFGVFKSYASFNNIDRKEQIQSERAAYVVDLMLGFDLVPPTVIRKLPKTKGLGNEMGSLQEFVENSKIGSELDAEQLEGVPVDERMKLALFDFIIQSRDRHTGNFLVKDNKIYAIDNGFSLGKSMTFNYSSPEAVLGDTEPSVHSKFSPVSDLWSTPISEEMVGKIKSFVGSKKENEAFIQSLKDLVGDKKAKLYLARIKCVASSIKEDMTLDKNIFNQKAQEELSHYSPALAA